MNISDHPINNKEKDFLRRQPLAEKICEVINQSDTKESFVIGIEGVWGSGKTSFVNLIKDFLKENEDNIIIDFNPWNFTEKNELIADFFVSLLKPLEKELGKDYKKIVKRYGAKLISGVTLTAGHGIIGFNAEKILPENTLEEERKLIDDKLRNLSKKIIIVIDDIDRLDANETRLIMKLVKMTGNFPNTIFLLAYDRVQVAKRLDSDGSGEEYLKKIIQLPFTLPAIDKEAMRTILAKELEKVIESKYGHSNLTNEEQSLWNNLILNGFSEPFKTIRDVKRYISSLELTWGIVGVGEVNKIDFIAIEMIKVFTPELYNEIFYNSEFFLGNKLSFREHNAKQNQEKLDVFIECVPQRQRDIFKNICNTLFPRLNSNYGGDFESKWRKDLRVCSESKFSCYFQLALPNDEISEMEFKQIMTHYSDKVKTAERTIDLFKRGLLRKALVKVVDNIENFSLEEIKNILFVLFRLPSDVYSEKMGMFDFDNIETQTHRIAYFGLKRFPSEQVAEYIKSLLNDEYLFPVFKLVAVVIRDMNKKDNFEKKLVSETDVEEISNLFATKIENMANDGSLENEKELVFLLFRWKEIVGDEKVHSYIKDLISTRVGLANFILGFVAKVYSTSGDHFEISKESINALYPIEEIEKEINKLNDMDYESFSQEQINALDLFKNPKDDF